jgi:PPOX class probable F420-dependent enzyme
MSDFLTTEVRELLLGSHIAHLATVSLDGSPHVAPVWIDVDPSEDLILVNTEAGRVKHRNLERDPRVAISIHAQSEPLVACSIRGTVVGFTQEDAHEHIDTLSRRYDGVPWPAHRRDRIIIRIRPERISWHS